jgi:hypothetical protein
MYTYICWKLEFHPSPKKGRIPIDILPFLFIKFLTLLHQYQLPRQQFISDFDTNHVLPCGISA